MLSILVCLLICPCFFGVHSEAPLQPKDENVDSHPIIVTRDGAVRGRKAKTVDQQTTYYAFQGIPFAEPPIGPRRFKAPERKSNWRGILNATEDKSECLQYANPTRGSEDCLYLNVYTPKLQGRKLPVMAWIYGGGFTFGNSSYSMYGPDYLLEQDIVFVSFNYRLGIFGFGSTADSICPGNFGLKDQILALRWVKENIALFGGDPNRVTIFGESAGSASVSYLLQTELTKDLFRAAIMESGTSLCLWALDRKSRETMFLIGKALNIDTSSSSNLIAGLRKINSTTLQNVAFSISLNVTLDSVLEGIVFAPVKESGIVGYSEQMLSQGRFHRKPVIIGFNSDEINAPVEFTSTIRTYFDRLTRNKTELVPIDLTRNRKDIMQSQTEIRSFYFGGPPSPDDVNAELTFLNDDLFYRPIRRTIIDQSKYVPVYFYQFSYVGLLGGGQVGRKGAGHAEELGYLFRTDRNFTIPPKDKLIRSRMVKLWTNFAKYNNPTPSKDIISQNITWSPTNPHKLLYLDIDSDMTLQLNPFNKNMKFWDRIYEEYGDPPFDTY